MGWTPKALSACNGKINPSIAKAHKQKDLQLPLPDNNFLKDSEEFVGKEGMGWLVSVLEAICKVARVFELSLVEEESGCPAVGAGRMRRKADV